MKYWKQGFYDEPIEGSVEIEDDYYNDLLEGQSEGKEIYEGDNGVPILVEHEYSIDEIKEMKVSRILLYDKSKAVNSFTLSGKEMWLDKDTRVGLKNSILIEQDMGRTKTVLWFDGVKYTIPILNALAMLNSLELYALDCYNVTQLHLAAIKKMYIVSQIEEYDYTVGYPEKLLFE